MLPYRRILDGLALVFLSYDLRAVYEQIERSLRLNGRYQRHLVHALVDELSALIECTMHLSNRVLRTVQRFHCRCLRNRTGVRSLMALDAAHQSCDIRSGTGIADSPSGHGIALGYAAAGDGLLVNLFAEGSDAYVLLLTVEEVLVHLIRYDEEVMLHRKITDRAQFFLAVDHTSRVIRSIQNQCLGLIGYSCCQLINCKLVILLSGAAYKYGNTACQTNDLRIAEPVGSRNDNLVALIQDRFKNIRQRVLAAIADYDLVRLVTSL